MLKVLYSWSVFVLEVGFNIDGIVLSFVLVWFFCLCGFGFFFVYFKRGKINMSVF